MNPKVAIMNADFYDVSLLTTCLEDGLSDLGVSLPHASRVLLKPNILSQNYPSQATTTHPAIVEALCGLLRDNHCTIRIGESSAFYQPGHTSRAFRTSGIAAVAKKFDAELVAFEEDGGWIYHRKENVVFSDVLLTRRLMEIDCLINLPKLKTHSFFRLSGAVKNLFGLVPGGTKYEYHFIGGYHRQEFGEKLADIAAIAQPFLSIMDAVVGLEGQGPAATGKPKRTGLLLLSENPYALDSAAAQIIGLEPLSVMSTVAGEKRGLIDPDASFQVCGEYKECPSVPYRLPPMKEEESRDRDTLYKMIAVRPVIDQKKCVKCNVCSLACPFKAIKESGDVTIDYQRCLNCYYCFYICPHHAIRLRGARYAPVLYAVRRLFRI